MLKKEIIFYEELIPFLIWMFFLQIFLTYLIEKYHTNRVAHMRADCKETQLRVEFIDPLFELLGWDIKNT